MSVLMRCIAFIFLKKKNELDSEKDFLANWLFDRLEKEDDKIKLNTFEPAKTT